MSVKPWVSAEAINRRRPYSFLRGDRRQSLYFAAWRGDVQSVKAYIDEGRDVVKPNRYGFTPLSLAVMNMHRDVVKILLDAVPTVEHLRINWCPSMFAVENNDVNKTLQGCS